MASAEMQKFAEIIRSRRPATPPPIEQRRRDMEEMQARLQVPEDVRTEDLRAGVVPLRWVSTPGATDDTVVLYFHGGGYVQGSLDTHLELMGRVSRAAGARVLGVDYRLAPEHPYPAALEDAVLAYHWLLAQDVEPNRVVVAGDSAGGGLALALVLKLRDDGVDLPAGAVLLSPWTDLTGSGESMRAQADADPMINPDHLLGTAALYHGATDPREPLVSPLMGELGDLPPLLVQVGEAEVLLDDARRVVEKVEAAGGAAELQCWEGAFHVFQAVPMVPEAGEALAGIGAFVRRVSG